MREGERKEYGGIQFPLKRTTALKIAMEHDIFKMYHSVVTEKHRDLTCWLIISDRHIGFTILHFVILTLLFVFSDLDNRPSVSISVTSRAVLEERNGGHKLSTFGVFTYFPRTLIANGYQRVILRRKATRNHANFTCGAKINHFSTYSFNCPQLALTEVGPNAASRGLRYRAPSSFSLHRF